MDESDLTMEEYINLHVEKARRNRWLFNWETATYWNDASDEYDDSFSNFEGKFPAIVFGNKKGEGGSIRSALEVGSIFNTNPETTMEEYVQYKMEKALKKGETYNWETVDHVKLDWDFYGLDVNAPDFFETNFPAIVYNNAPTDISFIFSFDSNIFIENRTLPPSSSLGGFSQKLKGVSSRNDFLKKKFST
ncbi:hypothetical protein Tco_0763981 [Tanacetum coccineum]